MIRVYAARISPLMQDDYFDKQLSLVRDVRKEKVMKYRNKKDRCRSLAAGLLLKKVVLDEQMDYESLFITEGKHGKPQINECENFHYNLSHAGDYAVVVVADVPVGIDIEEISHMRNPRQIYKKILTEQEKKNCLPEDRDNLVRIWTKKEAYAKALGKGLSVDFSRIETSENEQIVSQILVPGVWMSVCTLERSLCCVEVKWVVL